jgi:anti-sigma-K factor RskA
VQHARRFVRFSGRDYSTAPAPSTIADFKTNSRQDVKAAKIQTRFRAWFSSRFWRLGESNTIVIPAKAGIHVFSTMKDDSSCS